MNSIEGDKKGFVEGGGYKWTKFLMEKIQSHYAFKGLNYISLKQL